MWAGLASPPSTSPSGRAGWGRQICVEQRALCVGPPPFPLCGLADQVDTAFCHFWPFRGSNSRPVQHLRLVDRFSRLVSTCASENHVISRSTDGRWLTPEAKRGVPVNHGPIPAVLVDIVQFNRIVKEQIASGFHSAHANMYRRLSRPNVFPKIANWTIFHKIVASHCGEMTCGCHIQCQKGQPRISRMTRMAISLTLPSESVAIRVSSVATVFPASNQPISPLLFRRQDHQHLAPQLTTAAGLI